MSDGNGATATGYLSKQAILSVQDLPYEDVTVAEWGGTVRVRGLTGTERGIWEKSMSEVSQGHGKGKGVDVKYDLSAMRVALCTLCMVDAIGERLFKDHEVALLGQKSAKALQSIYEIAARLSGISEEAVEDAAKGSGETQEDAGDSVSA